MIKPRPSIEQMIHTKFYNLINSSYLILGDCVNYYIIIINYKIWIFFFLCFVYAIVDLVLKGPIYSTFFIGYYRQGKSDEIIFCNQFMGYKIINMSSVRNWGSERLEKPARTQRTQSFRQKSLIINAQPRKEKDEQTIRIFSKQSSSFYENQDKSDQSQIKIETSQQLEHEDRTSSNSSSFPSKITKLSRASDHSKQAELEMSMVNKSVKKQPQYKNLQDIQVGYKQIQEFKDEKQRQEDAREFVLRIQRQKRQFEGRIYLIKRQQQQKKKKAYYDQIASKMEQRHIKKLQRVNEAQKRLEQFKNKSIERQEFSKRQRAYSVEKNLSKIKLKLNKYQEQQKVRVESPTQRLGKKYLEQSGRVRKRAVTQSTQYYDLTEQQREELDRIRQKIDLLTKSMKK